MSKIDPVFQIVSPCPRQWGELGPERRRYCETCQRHVHNLSALNLAEREEFKRQLTGPACVTYEMLPDGSMAGPRRFEPLRKWLRLAAAAVAVLVPFFGTGCAATPPLSTGGLLPPSRRNEAKDGKSIPAANCEPSRTIVAGGV